jgi:NAD(P)H-hydrate epimerase
MQEISTIPACPARPSDAHKGTFGTVVVVGGCATMLGAPALCAAAALRGGAGLVKVCVEPAILPFVLAIEPSATGLLLGDAGATAAALDHADPDARAVLAIGPGMGRGETAQHVVMTLLRGRRAAVLDADGLNALAASKQRLAGDAPRVLTPHPGEYRRLAEAVGLHFNPADSGQRAAAAGELARAHHAVVVLKGAATVISDGERCRVNRTGNPALATAGSGDVLTGLIAALLAQGMTPFDAASLGAHLHGLAADRWAQQHGPSGLTARDLAAALPDTFVQHRRESAR